MLAEFLIKLKLKEEQDKISQIVTGSSGSQVTLSAYDEYINASKGKYHPKEKAEEEMEKEGSRIGVYLAMTIGSRMVVKVVIIAQGFIQDDSPEDVRFVDRLVTILLNAPVQSSRILSGVKLLGKRMSNGRTRHGRLRSTKLQKARRKREEVEVQR